MSWAITGTPGVGKTSVATRLELDYPIVHLNDLIKINSFSVGRDPARGSTIADIDALTDWFADQPTNVIIESHVAHFLPVDRIIVLRCHPDELRERLAARAAEHDGPTAMIEENVEAERLDLILSEAIERHGFDGVFELDTSGRPVSAIVSEVERVIRGEFEPRVGVVSFLEEDDPR